MTQTCQALFIFLQNKENIFNTRRTYRNLEKETLEVFHRLCTVKLKPTLKKMKMRFYSRENIVSLVKKIHLLTLQYTSVSYPTYILMRIRVQVQLEPDPDKFS